MRRRRALACTLGPHLTQQVLDGSSLLLLVFWTQKTKRKIKSSHKRPSGAFPGDLVVLPLPLYSEQVSPVMVQAGSGFDLSELSRAPSSARHIPASG